MARGIDTQELRRLAQLGARARLAELDQERAYLLREFPGLRRLSAVTDTSDASGTAETGPGESLKPRRRRGMSAGARKAVSARMKAYWASRRASERRKAS
jgi:hypothetical protein